ncbi:MAG TPA: cytochrome c biogenesis protein DipZ [Rhodoblastus sp.]|nr:cytochrome c biogenesis protein DipZ [Rhodoblastus sp.]
MILFLLAFIGGALTIASPCILPVLPFVFAGAGQSFWRRGFPMLLGMAATFALVATLAAFGGGWAAHANSIGRALALTLLALFGLALLWPGLAERLSAPLVALGGRLSQRADAGGETGGMGSALLLGVATGLLWAPCAGPILGIILTGAALQGATVGTTLLLLAYGLGAATSLALALLVGGRVFAAMKRSLGVGEWARRGFGALVLLAVAAIALGADTGLLTRLSLASTSHWEEGLLKKFGPSLGREDKSSVVMATGDGAMMMKGGDASQPRPEPARASGLPVEGLAPPLTGAVEWVNSPPLSTAALKGKVVLVDFWTYSCINCLRTLPYVRAWAEKYRDQGLVVIGVHAPEFAFEKDVANVKRAVADLQISYPVAIDNNYAIWRAFNNHYWPAHYFIDAQGRVRHHHFGEGQYDESEHVIQQLLAEAGASGPAAPVKVDAAGAQAAPDFAEVRSPETYIGYARAANFASPGGAAPDEPHVYAKAPLRLNEWSLAGDWTVGEERADLNAAGGAIAFRFHARDLHLVLGPGEDGKPVRFRVRIDGAAPGANHGADVDAEGEGSVVGERLYQLVRQTGAVGDRLFEIEFLDPGARAYAFTFG